jgi:hypothetical protein
VTVQVIIRRRRFLASIGLVGLMASLSCVLMAVARADHDDDDHADREHPIVTTPRISTRGDHHAVHLDGPALARAAIRTQRLHRSSQDQTQASFGSVVDDQAVARLVGAVRVAAAQRAGAQAQLEASHAQAVRARRLFEDAQTLSEGQWQAAEAADRAQAAAVAAAQAQLDASLADLRLGWGARFAEAALPDATHDQGWLEALLNHRLVLLQVAMPPETLATPAPRNGRVQTADGTWVPMHWLGPAVSADPRLAGRSHYYTAAATEFLPIGSTCLVGLASGRRESGVDIPASARVWWQGRAWVYLKDTAGDFERREIPADTLIDHGRLRADFADNTEVVVQGAQVLLSEELRAENFSTDVGGR